MYILAGTNIPAPSHVVEDNDTQTALIRTLDGTLAKDLAGLNKRSWTLEYNNKQKPEYDTINTIYQAYLVSQAPVTFQITDANYIISQTTVHINLDVREFVVRGSSYISNFVLALKEN